MRTVAVLPVKRFDRAKQRLAAGPLDARTRRRLAEAMVGDVLEALAGVAALEAIVVVTSERRARRLAGLADAEILEDRTEAGQSSAVQPGIAKARALGAEAVLLVPGDTPALTAEDVEAALRATPPPPSLVVVPDRHGSGTNALVLAPPDVLSPAFGPGSRERHEAAATAAGATCRVVPLASLALDVDTPEDLDALRGALAARPGGAPRTRELLATLP